jgi:hypothetical protein
MDCLVLVCPTHHRAVHELGYVVIALGAGRFTFHRPDGTRLPDVGTTAADGVPPLRAGVSVASAITPTWGGEQLDWRTVVDGLAASSLVRAGYRPIDIPDRLMDGTLRKAAQWPTTDRAA